MSSCVSPGTSVDQGTLASSVSSNEFNELEANGCNKEANEKKTTGHRSYHFLTRNKSGTPNLVKLDSKIYEGKQLIGDKREDKRSHSETDSEDFYHNVDERMSRNSLEYPEHQQATRGVEKWLSKNESTSLRSPESLYLNEYLDKTLERNLSRGNVVGIRGFPSDRLIEENNRQRANYNQLKLQHFKLQSEHKKLRNKFFRLENEFRETIKRKDGDVEIIRALITQQAKSKRGSGDDNKTIERNDDSEEIENVLKLKKQIRQFENRMSIESENYEAKLDKAKRENLKLYEQVEEFNREITKLSHQVKTLKMQPEQKTLLDLHNEVNRLRDINETNAEEFRVLRESYAELESELKGMAKDQRRLDDDRNGEVSKMFTELCRLQVYQPKLEMILKTEREIKSELQNRIAELESKNSELLESIESVKLDLTNERMQTSKRQSVEVESLRLELARWQERYNRLQREKSDSDRLVQSLRHKIEQLDLKLQDNVAQSRENLQRELDDANRNVMKLESTRDDLERKLDQLNERLQESKLRENEANASLHQTIRQLELEKLERSNQDVEMTKLGQLRAQISERDEKLSTAGAKINQLTNELAASRQHEALLKQQLEELHLRIQSQHKSMDELKASKEDELAKLRMDLNYERYDRQVALKEIERELRSSFKELETMKCRFTNRLSSPSSLSGIRPKSCRKLAFNLDKSVSSRLE